MGNAGKILLIGDVSKVFPPTTSGSSITTATSGYSIKTYVNMLDAIDAAAGNSFAAIAVVMPDSSVGLNSALKALRDNSDGKIVLLVQMCQEPAAMQLVEPGAYGVTLADDYLICPIEAERFCRSVIAGARYQLDFNNECSGPVISDGATEKKIELLEKLATEDELTGLKNRRYIWEFSRQMIVRARVKGCRVTLLMFDIDNFKHYNDLYGHGVGDEILKQAAVLMQRCCRGHDVVGRIGGDEFAVVFWDDPHLKSAESRTERRSLVADHPTEPIFIARRFRSALEKSELGRDFAKSYAMEAQLHLLGPAGKGVLTISGGLATFPRDGSTIEQLFGQADKALLQAKRSGKNRIYLVGRPQNDIANIE